MNKITTRAVVECFGLAMSICQIFLKKGYERDQAELLASTVFDGLVESSGGSSVYVPTAKSVQATIRKNEMQLELAGRPLTESRVAALSRKYGISRRSLFYAARGLNC